MKGVGYFDRLGETAIFRFSVVGDLAQEIVTEEAGQEVKKEVLVPRNTVHKLLLPDKRAWDITWTPMRGDTRKSLLAQIDFKKDGNEKGCDFEWLQVLIPIFETGKDHSRILKQALKTAKLVVDTNVALLELNRILEDENRKKPTTVRDFFNPATQAARETIEEGNENDGSGDNDGNPSGENSNTSGRGRRNTTRSGTRTKPANSN